MEKSDPRHTPSDEELDDLNEHWVEPGDPDGVVKAEQEKREREAHPPRQPIARKAKKRHPFRKFIIIVVLLAAATYGAFWFGGMQGAKGSDAPKQPAKAAPKKPTVASTKPKEYTSTNFTLNFTYLSNWKVTDTTAKLLVASPTVQLTSNTNAKVNAHVIVTMLNKQTAIAGYPTTGATAVLESQKLTYKTPSTIQRAQTYLSFLGYTKATALDALYVTGDAGYLQSQIIPLGDVILGDPLVSVTFATCTSDDCASGTVTPVSLLASSWPKTTASKQIVDLLQSITLD